MREKKRIEWIDVAKGYGIILVVLGHCFNKGTILHNWIFSFHMPLFFLLSGYCFRLEKYTTVRELLKDKFSSLLVPYIKFWGIGFLFSLLIPAWRSELSLKGILIDIYCGYPSSVNLTSTWFLVALFMSELVFYIIERIADWFDCRYITYICIGISGIAGYMVSVVKSIFYDTEGQGASAVFLPGNRLPLTLDTCMTALVFLAIGYWIKKYGGKLLEIKHRFWIFICLFIINAVVALRFNSRVNMHGCTYGNGLFFYSAALAGSIATIYFAKLLCSCKTIIKKKIVTFFRFYGKNSLLMLGMQSLGINLFVYVLNKMTENQFVLYENVPWKMGSLAAVFIIALFLPATYWLNSKLNGVIKI